MLQLVEAAKADGQAAYLIVLLGGEAGMRCGEMMALEWTDVDLAAKLSACIHDPAMRAKLASTSAHMQAQNGPAKAARLLDGLLRGTAAHG